MSIVATTHMSHVAFPSRKKNDDTKRNNANKNNIVNTKYGFILYQFFEVVNQTHYTCPIRYASCFLRVLQDII